MTNIYMLCGVAGSGKSTWAKRFKELEPRTAIISRDKIRDEVRTKSKEDSYFTDETLVFNIFISDIQDVIDNKNYNNVIIDATYLTKKARKSVLSQLDLNGNEVTYVNFILPLDKIKEQNAQRTRYARVPEEVIEDMYNRFKPAVGRTITIKGE